MKAGARLASAGVVLLIAGVAVLQLVAIARENVNWDELALLGRVSETVRTGKLQGGGRPGLTVLMLVPFVSGCVNSVDAVVAARHLWVGFNLATLIGLVVLLRGVRRDAGALVAVALVCLLPVWLRWSLQIRTEQPAIAATVWAGAALLASRRRPRMALAAGALAGVGYLCTQKALYATALMGLVAAGALFIARELRWRRELWRLAGLVAGALGTAVAYHLLVPLFYEPARTLSLERGLGNMAYFRATFGYRAYWAMLPTLLPQLVIGALLALATLDATLRRSDERRTLAVACAVAALGLAVGVFHAPAFPYFWITLGVFPAIAAGLAWPGITASLALHMPNLRAIVLPGIAALLVWHGGNAAVRLVARDRQSVQRDSMAFIARNFAGDAHGFHAESALFCRREAQPFPNYFSDRIVAMTLEDVRWLIGEMRRRPVSFIIAHRLMPFPQPVEDFWRTHYVLYHAQVLIPGQQIAGRAGASGRLEVISAGRYKWWPLSGEHELIVDGVRLPPRGAIALEAGLHRLELPERVDAGVFALEVRDPPRPSPATFYDLDVIDEITPTRRRLSWW